MVNQASDTLAQDSLGVRRRRGRPSEATEGLNDEQKRDHARNLAAQRQRAYRDRLKASGTQVFTVEVDQDVLIALKKFIEFKDLTQGEVVSRILRDRLLRKR